MTSVMLNASDYRCAEASTLSKESYIPCNRPATCFVKNRDRRPYPMCNMCASHNVRNREATVVKPTDPNEVCTAQDIIDSEIAIPRTELIEVKVPKESYIAFSVTEETVKPMAEKYLALKIHGIDDKQGIAKVTAARGEARKARTTVEAERVAAKKYYLEGGRKVDESAKIVQALIAPIEKHLENELSRVEAEIKQIEDGKLDARLHNRMDLINQVGGIPDVVSGQYPATVVRLMEVGRFTEFVQEMATLNDKIKSEEKERAELERLRKAESDRQQAEQKRLDEQRAIEHKAEQERLAVERRELDAQRAEQKKESDRLEAERKRIADIEAAKVREQESERLAAEKVKQAEKDRLAKEAAEKEAEARRAAALPHSERLIAYRDALLAVGFPELPQKYAGVRELIQGLRKDIGDRLTKMASDLK